MRRFFIIILAFCAICFQAFAQKAVTVGATVDYFAPLTESPATAKKAAIEKAKIKALADHFGTIINSTSFIAEGGSGTDFENLSYSEIKGEWLKDKSIDVQVLSFDLNNGLVLRAKVVGMARPLDSPGIDLKAKILRNGRKDSYESNVFDSGDLMYLSFKTPVKGYLAVYMLDGEDNVVYCLLPYMDDDKGLVEVDAGRDYLFFSPDEAPGKAESYQLVCREGKILNEICIVFSPNKFYKASDNKADEAALPRTLEKKDFNQWLSKLKTRDRDIQVIYKAISIQK